MARIDNREFVVSYLNSDNMEDVAKAMGISKASAVSKAANLRKLGVKLPKMKKSGITTLEIAQLNDLINKTLKGRQAA